MLAHLREALKVTLPPPLVHAYRLVRHTPEDVLASITTGSMAQYAEGLSEFEKRVVAVYVGGRPLGASAAGDASQMKNRCEARPAFTPFKGSEWNGWGFDSDDSRFQTNPGLTAADVPKLGLKWAFGFPNGNSAYSQPAVVGGRVFVGADTGFVYSMPRAAACTGHFAPIRGSAPHRPWARARAITAFWRTSATSDRTSTPLTPKPVSRSGRTASIRTLSPA